jgi:hypothetical protein
LAVRLTGADAGITADRPETGPLPRCSPAPGSAAREATGAC